MGKELNKDYSYNLAKKVWDDIFSNEALIYDNFDSYYKDKIKDNKETKSLSIGNSCKQCKAPIKAEFRFCSSECKLNYYK